MSGWLILGRVAAGHPALEQSPGMESYCPFLLNLTLLLESLVGGEIGLAMVSLPEA